MTQKQVAEFLYGSFAGQELETWDLTNVISQFCDDLANGDIDIDEFQEYVTDAFREANFAETMTEALITELVEAQ